MLLRMSLTPSVTTVKRGVGNDGSLFTSLSFMSIESLSRVHAGGRSGLRRMISSRIGLRRPTHERPATTCALQDRLAAAIGAGFILCAIVENDLVVIGPADEIPACVGVWPLLPHQSGRIELHRYDADPIVIG